MSKISIFTFISGLAIGAVGAWYITKTKYETYMQEEIDSIKAHYKKKQTEFDDSVIESLNKLKKTEPEIEEGNATELVEDDIPEETEEEENKYAKVLKNKPKPDIRRYTKKYNRYTDYGANLEEEDEGMDEPYIITPDDFGDKYVGYTAICLSYYDDGVLADTDDEILEDIEGTIGYDCLSHIGEYESDTIHVRNDRLKCDYEILRDYRTYQAVIGPYRNLE